MPRIIKRLLRIVLACLVGAAVAAVAGGLWFRHQVRASLPTLDDARVVEGLRAPVRIDRDALGIPTIVAERASDVALGTGFVHGRDRFFQIDLARRRAAGELAELFGPAALPLDRTTRTHRFRSRARGVLASATPRERAMLEAYAQGVNAGLASLGARPFEYLLMRVDPEPWRPEDSVLVLHSMFLQLQDETAQYESRIGLMRDLLPPELVAFLVPPGTEWDTPLVGAPLPAPPLPGAEVVNLRTQPPSLRVTRGELPTEGEAALGGSNSWALSGEHTADGATLLANDMHLGISVPHIWYRASLVWEADHGDEHRVTGVTLPGLPTVVVGSNGHVAWSFTNTHGDWSDLVVLEGGSRDTYHTPDGPRPFERVTEQIRVKGQADEPLEVTSTIWGPLIDEDHRGRRRALSWVAHREGGTNLQGLRLGETHTVEEAIDRASAIGIPAQNLIVVDRDGHLGWSIAGRIPKRVGFDGRAPTSWADGRHGWDGWLAPQLYPRIIEPEDGHLWSANNRAIDGEPLQLIGDAGYDVGARARQIRDGLLSLRRATPADMLAIQLDDRALFLERWRDLLLSLLTPEALATGAGRADVRYFLEHGWTGRASIESVGYRLVRTYRVVLAEMVLGSLTEACTQADPRFDVLRFRNYEGPLWRLVQARPPHLLDSRYRSWGDQLLAAVDRTLEILHDDEGALVQRTWGERNTAAFRHPLSRAVPTLGRWLDMPPDRLPGDDHMPRFQSPVSGASQRMAVSPGREADGYFHMPVGQSGHPLSPHYRDAHDAWVGGKPTPFLPGPAIHHIVLEPTP